MLEDLALSSVHSTGSWARWAEHGVFMVNRWSDPGEITDKLLGDRHQVGVASKESESPVTTGTTGTA
jgi:hypothetical protein